MWTVWTVTLALKMAKQFASFFLLIDSKNVVIKDVSPQFFNSIVPRDDAWVFIVCGYRFAGLRHFEMHKQISLAVSVCLIQSWGFLLPPWKYRSKMHGTYRPYSLWTSLFVKIPVLLMPLLDLLKSDNAMPQMFNPSLSIWILWVYLDAGFL